MERVLRSFVYSIILMVATSGRNLAQNNPPTKIYSGEGYDQGQTVTCPNMCSGHGSCEGLIDVCTCFLGWHGADCSDRWCPFGPAHIATPTYDLNRDGDYDDATDLDNLAATQVPVPWLPSTVGSWESYPADGGMASELARTSSFMLEAASDYELHFTMECSNAGRCDRGECICLRGYTGAACDRVMCVNDCSGHGACATGRHWQRNRRITLFLCHSPQGACAMQDIQEGTVLSAPAQLGDDPITAQKVRMRFRRSTSMTRSIPWRDPSFSSIPMSMVLSGKRADINGTHQAAILTDGDSSTVTFTCQALNPCTVNVGDETVLCSADVRARFAVGEWIKIGTQVRQVTAVSAYELTVASPGFTVSSSTGYKFFHRGR